MNKRTITDIDINGKRVLVRVDYNVPIKDGVVGDELRITASFDTIKYLLDQNCAVVLISHLGRPDGKADPKLSLAPVAARAAELLGREIKFAPECVGPVADAAVRELRGGEVLMLENLRFHPEEEANDADFARALAKHGEVFVDDAFAVVHRAHASTVGIPQYLPAVAGLLVAKEIDAITGALDRPNRPLVAIVGGAKVSTKIGVLKHLLEEVDALIIGGAMANTFFIAQGKQIGKSIAEPDFASEAASIIDLAAASGKPLVLPEKLVVSDSLDRPENLRVVASDAIPADAAVVDAAPDFAAALPRLIDSFLDFDGRATVIWNGPLGIMEIPEFAAGTLELAKTIAALPQAATIIGGGDTAAFVDDVEMHDRFAWVSTGGGASLDLMAGKALPGVEALQDK